MRIIKVSEKCNGCGLCVVNSQYLTEDDEGCAVPIAGRAVAESDYTQMLTVLEECPVKALSMQEAGFAQSEGRQGELELLDRLKKEVQAFHVEPIAGETVKFEAKKYQIQVPYSVKEYASRYSSKSQAESAARDEFRRICYGESAYRPILKRIFVEYKVRVLKPYYAETEVEDNIYDQYNRAAEKLLHELYAEACALGGQNFTHSSDWPQFRVYPRQENFMREALRDFDDRSTSSGIMAEFQSSGEYTRLSWYIDRMDFDYHEVYEGEGLFGKSKYSKEWYFTGMNAVVAEFVEDLKFSIDMVSSDIAECAADLINSLLGEYEKLAKAELEKKIVEFAGAWQQGKR